MSRGYANVSKIMPKQIEEQEAEETPKPARAARGTSPYVQVKVRRDIYEIVGVIAKMNSMTGSQVVEKILEAHTETAKEGLQSLKLNSNF